MSASWWVLGLGAVVLFIVGGIGGALFERQQTADVLSNMTVMLERLQAPPVSAAIIPPKKSKKQKAGI